MLHFQLDLVRTIAFLGSIDLLHLELRNSNSHSRSHHFVSSRARIVFLLGMLHCRCIALPLSEVCRMGGSIREDSRRWQDLR